MLSRRKLITGAGAITAAASAAAVGKVAMAALPEPVIQTLPDTMPPLLPGSGRPYQPVVTLNGWTLPWRMNQGVKEFHLVAEPVVRDRVRVAHAARLLASNAGARANALLEAVESDEGRQLRGVLRAPTDAAQWRRNYERTAGNKDIWQLVSTAMATRIYVRAARDRAPEPESDFVERLLPWAVPRPLIQIALGGLIGLFGTRGVTLEPEDRVFFMFGAANRDEAFFDDPDRFDLDRKSVV